MSWRSKRPKPQRDQPDRERRPLEGVPDSHLQDRERTIGPDWQRITKTLPRTHDELLHSQEATNDLTASTTGAELSIHGGLFMQGQFMHSCQRRSRGKTPGGGPSGEAGHD